MKTPFVLWAAVLALAPLGATAQTLPVLPPMSLPEAARPTPGEARLRLPEIGAAGSGAATAAPTVITSDELQMDLEKKIATFIGHVKVVDAQGTMTADRMVIYLAPAGETENSVTKIEATGGVVIAQEGRKANADEAVYTAADKTVLLSGAAQVQTDSGLVTGETIQFDMAKNTAVVKGKPRMTIIPAPKTIEGGLFPSVPKLTTPGNP
jgi:lipopolysaccharide transport protein LptA